MEATFKKNLEKSYMLLDSKEQSVDDYRVRILRENKIPGLCNVSLQQFNNNIILKYDITGKESFEHHFISKKIKAQDIKLLMFGIHRLMDSVKEYMLDINKIVLDLDYIFLDVNNYEISFCYYPDKEEDLFQSIRALLNRLIQIADHTDKETIIISYGLQQLGTKENITISEIMNFVRSNTHTEGSAQLETLSEGEIVKDTIVKEQTEIEEDFFREKEDGRNQLQRRSGMLWERLKEFFYRIKPQYVTESDIVSEPQTYDAPAEETILLTNRTTAIGVILKSKDIEMAQTIIPSDFPCVIGKSRKSADCIIDDSTISRVHLRINEESDGYYIEDLNSTNGTFLNGEKVKPHMPLKITVGDSIRLSKIEYIVC